MKCVICKRQIEIGPGDWDQGHNASPVAEGRCCGACNDGVVIPVRLEIIFASRLTSCDVADTVCADTKTTEGG